MSPVAVSQLSLFSESGVDEEAIPGTLDRSSQLSSGQIYHACPEAASRAFGKTNVVTTVATYSSPSPECLTSGDETRERPRRQM